MCDHITIHRNTVLKFDYLRSVQTTKERRAFFAFSGIDIAGSSPGGETGDRGGGRGQRTAGRKCSVLATTQQASHVTLVSDVTHQGTQNSRQRHGSFNVQRHHVEVVNIVNSGHLEWRKGREGKGIS